MSRRSLSHDPTARRDKPRDNTPRNPREDGRPWAAGADRAGGGPREATSDERIATILHELAVLGRRIGRRAADLARLADAARRTSAAGEAADARAIATAATDLAAAVTVHRGEATRAAPGPLDALTLRRHPQGRRRSTTRWTPTAPQRRPHDASVTRRWPGCRAVPRRSFRCGPFVTSGVVHAISLAMLSLLFLRGPTSRPPLTLEFGAAESPLGDAVLAVDLTPAEPPAATAAEASADAVIPASALDITPSPEIATPLAPESLSLESFAMDEPVDDTHAADSPPTAAAAVDSFGRIAGGDLMAEAGGGTGRKPGAGRVAGGASGGTRATSFFGHGGEGRSVCFLCDNSNSHRDGGFHVVLEELARAVDGLRPDQSFFVVFFSDAAYPLFHPAPAHVLAPATPDNKRRLRAWLETVEMCRGGQGIHDAVQLAGSLEPDVVYLLTDGQMTGTVVDRVTAADFGTAVVHTLGIQQPVVDRRTGRVDADRAREQEACNRNLITIAAAHGGGFTPVIVPPPAAALERLRPIARNRARGAVWGLKL